MYKNVFFEKLLTLQSKYYFRTVRDKQNITERVELRKNLKCKSFEWYLDNIWPQHFFPKTNRFFGRIRNIAEDKCLIKPVAKRISNQPMGIAKIDT